MYRPWVLLVICAACQATNLAPSTTPNPADSTHQHLHHHYQHNSTSSRSVTMPVKIRETTYRPKVGEILVKDSILYSQKPAAVRHLRRQLWPIMEETMDTIAKGVATGAKILHHMMRPNLLVTGDPKYIRRIPAGTVHIKNVYMPPQALTAGSVVHKRHVKPIATLAQPAASKPTKPTFKLPKPTTIVVGEKPVNTISDDYVLRYSGGTDPSYTIRHNSKKASPFADMGVTGYKHFEATVLRELEEKEERKVEASMAKPDSAESGDADEADESPDWKPMTSVSSTMKPKGMSDLHTNTSGQDIKPVHEDVQESKGVSSTMVSPKMSRYMARRPFKPLVVATVEPTTSTAMPSASSTTTHHILDVPNYPDFYIQQNRHLIPTRNTRLLASPMAGSSTSTTTTTARPPRTVPKPDDLNSALDFGRYRAHFQHIGSPPAHRPTAATDMDASQSKTSVTLSSSPGRPVRFNNRHPVRTRPDAESGASVDESLKRLPAAAQTSRGKVKFGDRLESS